MPSLSWGGTRRPPVTGSDIPAQQPGARPRCCFLPRVKLDSGVDAPPLLTRQVPAGALVLISSAPAWLCELWAEAGHAPWAVPDRKPDVIRQASGLQRAPGSPVVAVIWSWGGRRGLREARGESREEAVLVDTASCFHH